MTLYDSGAITYGKGLLGYYSFCQQSRPWTSQPVVVFAVVGVLMYSGGVQTYFASGCLLYGCTLYAARLEWRTVCSPDTTPPPHHCGVTDCCVLCHNSRNNTSISRRGAGTTSLFLVQCFPCRSTWQRKWRLGQATMVFFKINFRSGILGAVHKLRDRWKATSHLVLTVMRYW